MAKICDRAVKLFVILIAITGLISCCPGPYSWCNGGGVDSCAAIGDKTHADLTFMTFDKHNVHSDLPENQDNIFWTYTTGGANPSMSLNPAGAQGVAFRARVVDANDVPHDVSSWLFLTFILGYEFPPSECTDPSRLTWEIFPSLHLPNGLEVDSALNNTNPGVRFDLHIIEDPEGVYAIDSIPGSVMDSSIRDTGNYSQTTANSFRVFRNNHTGSFTVNPGDVSRLYVALGVWLNAPKAGDEVCIGCNLTGLDRNNVLESAYFSIGAGNDRGPLWYITP